MAAISIEKKSLLGLRLLYNTFLKCYANLTACCAAIGLFGLFPLEA
jgi:hypothetical protein